MREYVPDWAVVMGIAGVVGAVSAVVAVAVYRDLLNQSPEPVPVESQESDV